MNVVKLYGAQTSAFEYIKMMINQMARKANLNLEIEEVKSAQKFIEDNISSLPAIKLKNKEVLYYQSHDNINAFIKNAYKKILTQHSYQEIKHFLVPIDHSNASLNAARYALNLAKDISAVVTFLHCYVPHSDDTIASTCSNIIDLQKDEFEKTVKKFESEFKLKDINAPVINSEFHVSFPGDTIIERAHKLNATVIMGNSGEGNITKRLFGSVSTKVVMDSKQPTIIIPKNVSYNGFNEIAYAMNDLRVDSKVVEDVIELVHPSYARINLVHIDKKESDNYNNQEELSKLYKVNYPKSLITIKEIKNDSITDGLNDFVNSNEIDLLVLTHEKKNILETIFKTSQSRKMAITSTTPVLILNI